MAAVKVVPLEGTQTPELPVADGFLGRWSQRKQAVREGKPPTPAAEPITTPVSMPASVQADADHSRPAPVGSAVDEQLLPSLTLDDVKALKADDSFARFVGRDVSPDVRNAAMKKLFSDPHYNIMDRLDIYIDDYSVPSPMPASMLKQMVSAQFLKLVEEPEVEPQAMPLQNAALLQIREDADTEIGPAVAQSLRNPQPAADQPASDNPARATNLTPHDHTDLRLQPNHSSATEEPGRGTQ